MILIIILISLRNFLFTAFAQAVDLKPVSLDPESGPGCNLLNGFLHGAGIELLCFSATGANQVTVLTLIDGSLESGSAVTEIDLPC